MTDGAVVRGDSGLASQFGGTDYTRERNFRKRLREWLRTVRSYWPECPAHLNCDSEALVIAPARCDPLSSCDRSLIGSAGICIVAVTARSSVVHSRPRTTQLCPAGCRRPSEVSDLEVRMCVDVQPGHGDTTIAAELNEGLRTVFTRGNRRRESRLLVVCSIALARLQRCAALHRKWFVADHRTV